MTQIGAPFFIVHSWFGKAVEETVAHMAPYVPTLRVDSHGISRQGGTISLVLQDAAQSSLFFSATVLNLRNVSFLILVWQGLLPP